MRNRSWLAAVAVLAMAGCGGVGSNIDKGVTESAAPSPLPCATGISVEGDISFQDPATCKIYGVGAIATKIRDIMGDNYQVKALLPNESFTCNRDGEQTTVMGNQAVRGFCNDKTVFVITEPGMRASVKDESETAAWFVLATTVANKRYPSSQGSQICAAAYAMSMRRHADLAGDLAFFSTAQVTPWLERNPLSAYAQSGQQLAISKQGMSGCDNPRITTTP